MKDGDTQIRPKPGRITGIRHVFAAAGYSIAGVQRLWKEAAFRHIVLAFLLCLGLLVAIGASWAQLCIFLILFLALIAVEALNTAIECIVDHLAPHWQEYARDAKDLGSLATMCVLMANGLFLGTVVLQHFEIF
ncbi:diacylglycerol kinase [Roseovarius arcticus]|uniref:diacylglycerol kinase n=1 Tax=Roseovarius arcticus TaxID=2547404 RepID=UPI0014866859|nr:diacylglycerol kinase [Roseovarius arcticus]